MATREDGRSRHRDLIYSREMEGNILMKTSIPAIETRRHLFQLVAAGFAGNNPVESTNLIVEHALRVGVKEGWTLEYANALLAGAVPLCTILVKADLQGFWQEQALEAFAKGII